MAAKPHRFVVFKTHDGTQPGPDTPQFLDIEPTERFSSTDPWFPFFVSDTDIVWWRRGVYERKTKEAAAAGDGIPGWARAASKSDRVVADVILAGVVRCLEAITQKPVAPHRAATGAKSVLALWRAEGRPSLTHKGPDGFVPIVELVAQWARESDDGLAARDIRGKGWEGGTDRSRSVSTLTVQAKWMDRVNAAKAWRAGGGGPGPSRAGARGDTTTLEDIRRQKEARRGGRS